MLTLKQGLKLSAIIDKLDLKITDPKADANKVGADLMMQIISKAHKAENEIYAFVAEIKKITPEEAAEIDLMKFIQDIMSDAGVLDFFKSAVKSKGQG
jgi:hypothetical protein